MRLDESTFTLYAAKYYDNPSCHTIEEFEEDLNRFKYLRKLFNRYKRAGDLKERLVLNHVIILYNCFGENATAMMFLKFDEYHSVLAPFLSYLNRLPLTVSYGSITIDTASIIQDAHIKEVLEKI